MPTLPEACHIIFILTNNAKLEAIYNTKRLPKYRIKQDVKSHNDRPTKDF